MKNHKLLLILFFNVSILSLSWGQVKTKIFDKGIPSSLIEKEETFSTVIIAAPDKLAEMKTAEGEGQANYSNQFALSKTVDIDIFGSPRVSAARQL